MARSAPCLRFFMHFRPLGMAIAALIGAVLFVWLFGSAVYTVEGLSFRVSLQPAWSGKTVLEFPPLGNISANTHKLPVTIQITLQNIETDLASSLFRTDTEKTVWNDLQTDFKGLIRPFLLRQIYLAMLGAAAAILLIWRYRPKMILAGALTGLLASGIFLFSLSESYDLNAFAQPEVNGVLSLAASVFPEPDNLLQKLDEIQSQTRLMVNNIEDLFSSTNGLAALAPSKSGNSTKKILLVGDLHSNPVGIELISSITDAFAVDLIIDTGDLTDFGSSIEASFVQELNTIEVPYLFCPGNHDTPEIMEAIKGMPQGIILEGNITEIAGLKILGSPDPLSSKNVVKEEALQNETLLRRHQVESIKSQAELNPDIVVVHDSAAAQQLRNRFPLIVTGHTHRQKVLVSDHSVIINPGTTGAAGIRGLYSEGETSYSAIILYIKPGEKATALDLIKYVPATHNFIIERKLLNSGSQSSDKLPDRSVEAVEESLQNQAI